MDTKNYKKFSGVIKIGQELFKNVKVENLIIHHKLGNGGFGTVTKCSLGHNILAVKKIEFEPRDDKKVRMELNVLRCATGSPNITSFYGYIISYNEVHVCLELMATCLDKLYKDHLIPQNIRFPECILGKIAVSVVKGLTCLLSEHGIMHHDIKPANILVDWNGTIKISDFGIAGKVVNSCPETPNGQCYAYSSPGLLEHRERDVRSDIWSLGITFVELASCEYPYENDGNNITICCAILMNPSPKLPNSFTIEFHDFVDSCLQKDVMDRPGYCELADFSWYQYHKNYDTDVLYWLSHVLDHSELI